MKVLKKMLQGYSQKFEPVYKITTAAYFFSFLFFSDTKTNHKIVGMFTFCKFKKLVNNLEDKFDSNETHGLPSYMDKHQWKHLEVVPVCYTTVAKSASRFISTFNNRSRNTIAKSENS